MECPFLFRSLSLSDFIQMGCLTSSLLYFLPGHLLAQPATQAPKILAEKEGHTSMQTSRDPPGQPPSMRGRGAEAGRGRAEVEAGVRPRPLLGLLGLLRRPLLLLLLRLLLGCCCCWRRGCSWKRTPGLLLLFLLPPLLLLVLLNPGWTSMLLKLLCLSPKRGCCCCCWGGVGCRPRLGLLFLLPPLLLFLRLPLFPLSLLRAGTANWFGLGAEVKPVCLAGWITFGREGCCCWGGGMRLGGGGGCRLLPPLLLLLLLFPLKAGAAGCLGCWLKLP